MNTNERTKQLRKTLANLQKEINNLYLLLEDLEANTETNTPTDRSTSALTTVTNTCNREVSASRTPLDDKTLCTIVTDMIHELGVPAHIKGYHYLRTAIIETYKNLEMTDRLVTKCLYPKIAEMHHSTPSRVERAIRHAIELSADNTAPETMEKYFGYSYSAKSGKPTNANFIATLVDYIKLHQ